MALFRRKNEGKTEERAITSLPWIAGGPSPSVVTAENAASLIPVFASMRIIADNIASLPLETFRETKQGLKPVTFTPNLFFNSPSARDNMFQWVHKCIVSLALRGNAYGLIVERDDSGYPKTIEWLHPDDVTVDESSTARPVFYHRGTVVPTDDMVHIPWIAMPGRVVGMSPVQAFASTIGVGLAATDYGKRWFDNGGTPPSVLKNDEKQVNPEDASEIRKRAVKSIRSGTPLVMGKDWTFEAIRVNPEESQFIQTMRLNASQIAAIYGVPPEMVGGSTGDSMTYSTVEQNAINLATLTLRPWLVRLEEALDPLIPSDLRVRFNVDAMIRLSTKDRYEAHTLALNWMSIDEVRALEKLPPLLNGEGAWKKPTPPALAPGDSEDNTEPDEGVTE